MFGVLDRTTSWLTIRSLLLISYIGQYTEECYAVPESTNTESEESDKVILSFDDVVINTANYELRVGGDLKKVEPKVFDLIVYFASHPGEVHSREALIEAVWPGRIVADATISTCVKNARKALGDTGEQQNYLCTVRGRGYRFSAHVSTRGNDSDSFELSTATAPPVARDDTGVDLSMMILPFRCLADNTELSRIAAGLALELDTILTRVPLLRLSVEGVHYEGQDPPPTARQVHKEFGVDFVLDGQVQDAGGAMRVNVQLSDARTGYRLWAETFLLAEPLASAAPRCIAAIVSKLEPQLLRAMANVARSGADAPTARQLFLQANALLVMHGWNHESFVEAAHLLRRSAELDSQFALAPALESLLHGFGFRIGLPADREAANAEAYRSAERALQIDSMDSTVIGLAGCALADTGHIERGERLLRNAIELNPANAQAWVGLGSVRIILGDMSDAVEKLAKGINLSPLDSRLSVWGAVLAVANLLAGDLKAASDAANLACQRHDRTYLPRLALAGVRLVVKDYKGALRALADARRIKPDLNEQQISAILPGELSQGLLALEQDWD